jgi:hypothetical protein
MHPLEIHDDMTDLGRKLRDAPEHLHGRAKEQRPLNLQHSHATAFPRQNVTFFRCADAF